MLRLHVLAYALCVATIGWGQTPAFRGRLDVVRTEVAVIDNKTGKPVTGLTERDFTISENGVRQTISSFVDEAREGTSTNPDDPANRRVFLFIVNAGNYDPYKKHDGLAQFIRERLGPRDLVGVQSLGRLSPMTTDHERIARIVERLKEPPPLEFKLLQMRKEGDGWGEKLEVQRFADNLMEPGSADTGFFRSAVPVLLGSADYRRNIDDTTVPWHVRLGIHDALKVVAGIEYIRALPGERHVVIFTAWGFGFPVHFGNEGVGLYLRSPEDDKRFAAQANNAGVAVDVVHLSGTSLWNMGLFSSANVAEFSGGQFSSLRIASQQLARIDAATKNGYILGYMPTKPELDGKYRDVKVTVNRKDVTVVYRHGYTGVSDPGHIDPEDIFTRMRLRDAATGASDLTDIRLQVKVAPIPGATRQVRVDLTIDVSKLPLMETAGKWEGDLEMLILCGDQKKEVVGRIDQHMRLSMTPATYDQAKAGGVPYTTTIPVTGQPAVVKVIVYHFDSDRIGVVTVRLR